jgi:hypothetical protein
MALLESSSSSAGLAVVETQAESASEQQSAAQRSYEMIV